MTSENRQACHFEVEPGLEDQAHDLLAATTVPAMESAAHKLRLTALNVRQRLMSPPPTNGLQPAPTVLDPELRRMELADLAVDVVTAVDYLLSLLASPPASPRLMLARGSVLHREGLSAEDDARGRLIQRRLDARSAAVRLGMRLVAELLSDVASS